MIISKKKFKEEIEKAVKLALEKKEEEIKAREFEIEVHDRIDSLSDSVYRDICQIQERIDSLEDSMCRKINDLSCKISHKRKPLNE